MPLGTRTYTLPGRLGEPGREVEVAVITGPAEAGPFPHDDEIASLVKHVLAFHKTIRAIYCLGDNLPPIAVVVGLYASGGAAGHEEDDTSVRYCLDGYGFHSLSKAIVFAIALRDRRNLNDARHTATAIERLLTAPED